MCVRSYSRNGDLVDCPHSVSVLLVCVSGLTVEAGTLSIVLTVSVCCWCVCVRSYSRNGDLVDCPHSVSVLLVCVSGLTVERGSLSLWCPCAVGVYGRFNSNRSRDLLVCVLQVLLRKWGPAGIYVCVRFYNRSGDLVARTPKEGVH